MFFLWYFYSKITFLVEFFLQATRLAPATPLTGRDYLKSRESSQVTPVSTATQSVSRLQNMISGHQAAPSQALLKIIELVVFL